MDSIYPKPLVEIKKKPILAYQLDFLLNSGLVDKIILALGERAGEIINFIQEKYSKSPIDFSVEKEKLDTGGAIKQALRQVDSDFVIVLNCDDITDINLENLKSYNCNTICVAHPRLPFGLVKEENGFAAFEEKPMLTDWVSCGWYLFKKEELMPILPDKGSLEYDVFPKLKLKMFKHEGFWRPLNTKKDLIEFEAEELPAILK